MSTMDLIFSELSIKDMFEVRITGTAAGDSVMDPEKLTTIKVRISGIFSVITGQKHQLVGIAEDAEAVLATTIKISLDSQIEVDDVLYEIVGSSTAGLYLMDETFVYALKRVQNLPES